MKRLTILVSLILSLAACAPQVRFMRYTSSDYPPTTKVEVLQIRPPDKQFTEIGTLSVKLDKQTEEYAVLYLVERGREIGADAIVILGEVSSVVSHN